MNWKTRLGDTTAKYTMHKEPNPPGHCDSTAMAEASVKNNCEGILKIFVSMFENHFNEWRNVDEVTATWEFEFSVNGPNLAHFEAVVKEAMDLHWGGKFWLCFRTAKYVRYAY